MDARSESLQDSAILGDRLRTAESSQKAVLRLTQPAQSADESCIPRGPRFSSRQDAVGLQMPRRQRGRKPEKPDRAGKPNATYNFDAPILREGSSNFLFQ